MRGRALAAAVLALAACRGATAPPAVLPSPEPAEAWPTTLAAVQELVSRGRHVEADSALAGFALRATGTPAAIEATYWRALVRLDPANTTATPRDALAALDTYLAGGATLPRYQEALVLRRTASLLEGTRRLPLAGPDTTNPAAPVSTDRLRATQDTMRVLRDELTRTQAELERIRRRLRPPASAQD